jgi:phosphotransferase system  glucose/maltose/N-acetylglucosamine-specific IIC component
MTITYKMLLKRLRNVWLLHFLIGIIYVFVYLFIFTYLSYFIQVLMIGKLYITIDIL